MPPNTMNWRAPASEQRSWQKLRADAILAHPEAGQSVLGSIRRRLVRRFPYAVIYTIRRPNVVRVLAVMNLKRRPAYWVGRA